MARYRVVRNPLKEIQHISLGGGVQHGLKEFFLALATLGLALGDPKLSLSRA